MHTTSLTLLQAISSRPNAPEWEKFSRLYRPMLVGWAIRQQFQPMDAEDIAQEVLRQLVIDLPSYQQQAGKPFRSWLFTVARHTASRFRQRVGTRGLPAADGLSGVIADSDFTELHEQEYEQQLIRQAVEIVKADFNPTTYLAFTRMKIDNQPAGTVAAELGISAVAVYSAVNRVMTRLQEELAGLMD